MATCSLCGAEYEPGANPCWRCHGDNSYFEEQESLTRYSRFWSFFGNVWGLMSVLLVALPLVRLAFQLFYGVLFSGVTDGYVAPDLGAARANVLAQFLAWFLSFIAVMFLYSIRLHLWHYSWIRGIRRRKTPALHAIASALFVLGVLLLLIYLTIALFWQPAPPVAPAFNTAGVLREIVMPTLYSLIFVSFSAGSMLMAALAFNARLNENAGPPIYMNSRLLSEVVERSVRESLEGEAELHVAGMERTPGGGVRLLLNRFDPAQNADDPEEASDPTRVDRRYEVESNEWGQILSMRERPVALRTG